jgi:hypothetical protein
MNKEAAMKRAIISLWICFIFLFPAQALAAIFNAASCSQGDVAIEISKAVDGDTVYLPSCSGGVSWNTNLTISKAITLSGKGVGQTVLVDNVSGVPMLEFNVIGTNKSWRLTGIEFRGGSVSKEWNFMLKMSGNSHSLQIDNCRFFSWATNSRAIGLFGDLRGVIYSNDFNNGNKFNQALLVNHSNWNGYSYGDGSWADDDNLGSSKFIFIENNIFSGPSRVAYAGMIDCYGGARVVLRYNTINNDFMASHGTESTQRTRGLRAFEVYNNTFNHTGGAWFTAIYIRGGTGVVYNNTAKTSSGSEFSRMALFANYRSNSSFPPWGQCNGSSRFDQNAGSPAGYACIDQPGRGKGNLISGDNPSPAYPNQVSAPIYVWGNKGFSQREAASDSGHVAENRDYFINVPKPGYSAFEYPHPLRSGKVPTPPVDPPKGLKIVE